MKQTGHNVYDPEPLNKTPEELKALIEETYKGYQEIKGVTQTIDIQDGKVVQDVEFDFSVASLDELRKAFQRILWNRADCKFCCFQKNAHRTWLYGKN